MALPPVGVRLVAQDATAFDSAVKKAGSVLDGFGKTASTVTAGVNTAFAGMASAVGGALAPIGKLLDHIFVSVIRSVVNDAIHSIERFAKAMIDAAIEGTHLQSSIERLGSSLNSVAKSSFAPFVDQLGKLVDEAAPAFLGIVQAAESYLGGLGQSALTWGKNFITQFASGMWAGVGEILQVLTEIANLITYWMSPGSPPRLLPDIDKWGTAAAGEYFGGWTKGAFTWFSELSGTLSNLIRSIPLPKGDQVGIIPSILGARQGIAAAVEELRNTGSITKSTMDAIVASVGTADESVRGYLESMIRLQAANANTRAAQEELNKVTKTYNDLLKPIEAEIAGISEEQQQLADEQKKSLLQLVLKDPGSTLAQKRQAQLEIERLDAEKRRRALLAEQKVIVEGAKEKLDIAKTAEQLAQEDFDSRKALIAAQTEQNNLLKEQLRLLESLNKEAGGGPKPAGGGKIGGPTPFSIKPFSFEDFIPTDIISKWEAFVSAILATWAKVLDVFKPAIEVWNTQVVPAWNHLVNAITSTIPAIKSAIAEMVAFIGRSMGITLVGVFENVAISLDTLAHIWETHHKTILAATVGTFKIIFTTISVTLLLISGIFASALTIISGTFDSWSMAFQGDWRAAWDNQRRILSDAWDIMLDTLAVALDAILLIVDTDTAKFTATWKGVWENAHIIVMYWIDLIREGIKVWTAAIGQVIRTDLGLIKDFWDETWERIATALDRPITAVNTFFQILRDAWQWLQDHVFTIDLPNIPGMSGPASGGPNGQVNGPSRPGMGGGVSYGGNTTTIAPTYAPTYISTAPPPSQGFATTMALFG